MSQELIKTTSIFASMTLISRLLGFARDTLAAQLFGVSAAVDAFYIAFKIPNSLRGLVEGPFSQVLVPVLSEYRETRSLAEVRYLISCVAGMLVCVLLVITTLGMVGAEPWLRVVTPGLDTERFQLARHFLRITFPYLPLISLATLGIAVMNCYGLFWGAALTPIGFNFCMIGSALLLSPYFAEAVNSQAWGVLLAGFVQLLFTLPFLKSLSLLSWPRLDWQAPGIRRIIKLMLPAWFGALAGQIGLLINTGLASFLPSGSVSWLYYADRLVHFPLSVFGIALSTAMLPVLSRCYVTKDSTHFDQTLGWGLRCNLLIALPAAITMGVLSGPLVISLFEYGKFTQFDVMQTRYAVLGYTLGVPAFMVVRALASAYYAQQDIQTPVKILLCVLVVNVGLGMVMIPWLKQGGITLAHSLSAWIQAILLFRYLRQSTGRLQPELGWWRWSLGLLTANSILIVWLYWVTPEMSQWFQWYWYHRLMTLFILGVLSVLLYGLVLGVMGFRKRDILGLG